MPTDVYCGVVPADPWPFSDPLVVELEVERGSYVVADVHISATLPGLRRYLRRRVRGLPITEVAWLEFDKTQGTYHAAYWHWVQAALVFALKSFKEDEHRLSDYFASIRHVWLQRHGIVPLQGESA